MTELVEEVPDNLDSKTLALGKWVFNLGGVVHDLKDVLKKFQISMTHQTDRGPEDYEQNERDLRDLLNSAVREGARRATINIDGGYHEGGGKDSWSKYIVPGIVTLVVTGIAGLILMYGKLSAFEAKLDSLQTQVNEVKKIVEPRYRGLP